MSSHGNPGMTPEEYQKMKITRKNRNKAKKKKKWK